MQSGIQFSEYIYVLKMTILSAANIQLWMKLPHSLQPHIEHTDFSVDLSVTKGKQP